MPLFLSLCRARPRGTGRRFSRLHLEKLKQFTRIYLGVALVSLMLRAACCEIHMCRFRSLFSLGISSSQLLKYFLSFCADFPFWSMLIAVHFLCSCFWLPVIDPSLISFWGIELPSLDAVCGTVFLGVLPSPH